VELGADALGCICTPASARYRTPEQISAIFADLPPYITRVAVVLNPEPQLLKRLGECPLDCIQFHGDESPELIAQSPLPWYKAVKGDAGYRQALRLYPHSPALLVDSPAGGGSGRPWDWSLLHPPGKREKPLILAGGLTPDNVAEAIATVRPWAVDVAGGVEAVSTAGSKAGSKTAPGVKDPALMRDFLQAIGNRECGAR